MKVKKNLLDHKDYLLICAGLVICLLAFLYFQHPRIVTETKTITKTIYVKADAQIVGATSATIAPSGAVSASGSSLSIITHSQTITKETEKEVIKYNQADWFVAVGYGTDAHAEAIIQRRIIWQVYAGIGLETSTMPLFATCKAKGYVGLSF